MKPVVRPWIDLFSLDCLWFWEQNFEHKSEISISSITNSTVKVIIFNYLYLSAILQRGGRILLNSVQD